MLRVGRLLCILCFLAMPGSAADLPPLFRPWAYHDAVVSPNGAFVAALVLEEGALRLRVIDTETEDFLDALELDLERHHRLSWIDGRTLAVVDAKVAGSYATRGNKTHLVRVARGEGGLESKRRTLRPEGWLVHSLPNVEDEFLFAVSDRGGDVYRLSAGVLLALAAKSGSEWRLLVRAARVAHIADAAEWWVADGRGVVRAALSTTARGRYALWYRRPRGDRFNRVAVWDDPQDFDLMPVGVAEDREKLLVVTRRDRDRYGLFEFDPDEGELGKLLYEHPSAELVGVVYSSRGSGIAGVAHMDAGQLAYHYFDQEGDPRIDALASRFPGRAVTITSRSADATTSIAWVRSPSDPGGFYLVDDERDAPLLLGRVAPWLDEIELSRVTAFRVESEGGLMIEAFFAEPASRDGPAPLVVVPHGGPIGVMDSREFSREVQYLARAGFAVLQVNYRGSGGYGRAFEDAGRGEWGRTIEDDVDRAVQYVMDRGWVDSSRMCIVGGSYGGYSALMSVIRHPRRFRCAATFAGVTDIALMFTSSDFATTREGRSKFARIVGDPRREYERMKAVSPVYRVDEIVTPLLVVHGAKDARVAVEHAERLRKMLDLYDKSYEWQLYHDQGHSFASYEQMWRYHRRLERFLTEHLQPGD